MCVFTAWDYSTEHSPDMQLSECLKGYVESQPLSGWKVWKLVFLTFQEFFFYYVKSRLECSSVVGLPGLDLQHERKERKNRK